MSVTDNDMATVLGKTPAQIENIKKSNEAEYRVLKIGVLCKMLNLGYDDLQKIHDKKVVMQ